ncbi:hypothetical protein V6N13_087002 [Hibiscus sabdariffa]|uniref:Uncharacterized protein n=1 Tax=Hibiscus sabdariffa TaxID=183260 RepID=A0ABR2FV34_9ROSI
MKPKPLDQDKITETPPAAVRLSSVHKQTGRIIHPRTFEYASNCLHDCPPRVPQSLSVATVFLPGLSTVPTTTEGAVGHRMADLLLSLPLDVSSDDLL